MSKGPRRQHCNPNKEGRRDADVPVHAGMQEENNQKTGTGSIPVLMASCRNDPEDRFPGHMTGNNKLPAPQWRSTSCTPNFMKKKGDELWKL